MPWSSLISLLPALSPPLAIVSQPARIYILFISFWVISLLACMHACLCVHSSGIGLLSRPWAYLATSLKRLLTHKSRLFHLQTSEDVSVRYLQQMGQSYFAHPSLCQVNIVLHFIHHVHVCWLLNTPVQTPSLYFLGHQQHDSDGFSRLHLTSSKPGLWTTFTLEMVVLKCAMVMVIASRIHVCEWIALFTVNIVFKYLMYFYILFYFAYWRKGVYLYNISYITFMWDHIYSSGFSVWVSSVVSGFSLQNKSGWIGYSKLPI